LTHIDFYQPKDRCALRWFLVQLKPKGLQRARCNLARQDFSLFCPMEPVTKISRGRFGSFWRELFPGYLFVGFDPATAPWRMINSTFGVARLVTFGKAAPTPLPADLIEGLQSRCDADGHLLPPKILKAGDRVQIVQGPFSDLTAKIERITPDQRVWVLLDVLGRQTPISLDRDHLQPA